MITIGRIGAGIVLHPANENRAPAARRAPRLAGRLRDPFLWLMVGAELLAAVTPAR